MSTTGLILSILCSIPLLLATLYFIFKFRFLRRLKRHASYKGMGPGLSTNLHFVTASANTAELRKLRDAHSLSAIAGTGTDEERAVRMMDWVHNLTKRSPNPPTPKERTAANLIHLCRCEVLRFNCWMYATVLNECLLSLGISSRLVHLSPPKKNPKESHFVVAVYLRDAGRWIMLDPDMRGWLLNEKGERLGISEIRDRLVSGAPLEAHAGVAIQGFDWLPRAMKQAIYKTYISKNIFRIACSRQSMVGIAAQRAGRVTYELIPDGYHSEWLEKPRTTPKGNSHVYLNNVVLFWQLSESGSSEPLAE